MTPHELNLEDEIFRLLQERFPDANAAMLWKLTAAILAAVSRHFGVRLP